ncbi:flagellar biosynthesis/type III secretory pathway protein FliH [Neobacillus niacini]|uniref:YHYH domain-containing protein n=1 Tax=Neobacillus driksii TaxID=3035913 RepID=UPI002783173F|nr:YHYH domain-containing protein [Neobacillus niacini]MDQ0974832.1 flagellar biosynthesis/type III secretory pathway protein FliH [Neobacillus niacini]
MEKKVFLFTLLFVLLFGTFASAHSGRTDSSGGHNCSEKSKAKGLCTGYHNHNGGGGSTSSGATIVNSEKDCTDFASYDEVVEYWNTKGYSATNDPENLDGWGNGVVDDGIPCEVPSGYDKTKINNSTEQIQHNQEEQDLASGENAGYPNGVNDGYLEVTSNNVASTGSEAYKAGYATGYTKGYDEGKTKITGEKTKAASDGYALGEKQDTIEIPALYINHAGLKQSFEGGFNKAVTERVEAKKKEYKDLGYTDGKKDVNNVPKDIEEVYVNAYLEGYNTAQEELKDEYLKQGYEAAFTILKYTKPNLYNEKFIGWYKEGFESNTEVKEISAAGLALGQAGGSYNLPSKYKNGEVIFKHNYELGLKEYEEQQSTNQKAAVGGVGGLALVWLGRRFYVAKKMIG